MSVVLEELMDDREPEHRKKILTQVTSQDVVSGRGGKRTGLVFFASWV